MPVTSEVPSAALWLFACRGAVAGGAGRLRRRPLASSASASAEALREVRAQGQLLAQLLDVWQWQTDRHHRLLRLQPPAGAPASAWNHGDWGGQPLWERFVADADSLRAQLESMVALADVAVRPVGASQDGDWLLRGVPRFDAEGQFEGYVGTARAGTAAVACRAEPGAARRRTVRAAQRAGGLQLHRDARPARADPRGRGFCAHPEGRLWPRARPHRQRPPRPRARRGGAHEQHDRRAADAGQPVGTAAGAPAGEPVAAGRLRHRRPAARGARAPGGGGDRAGPGGRRRPDAAAPGAREPARQRLEVQRTQSAGEAAVQRRHAGRAPGRST